MLALPIEVHHSAFADFCGVLADQNSLIDEEVARDTYAFMLEASRIEDDENKRSLTMRTLLEKLLDLSVSQSINQNKTNTNYTVSTNTSNGMAALAIIEETDELGTSGEATSQASFSYVHH